MVRKRRVDAFFEVTNADVERTKQETGEDDDRLRHIENLLEQWMRCVDHLPHDYGWCAGAPRSLLPPTLLQTRPWPGTSSGAPSSIWRPPRGSSRATSWPNTRFPSSTTRGTPLWRSCGASSTWCKPTVFFTENSVLCGTIVAAILCGCPDWPKRARGSASCLWQKWIRTCWTSELP